MNFKLLFIFLFLITSSSYGKILYYGSESIPLTLLYGKKTLIRFNEEVKTISQASNFSIHPADSKDPNYRTLAIKPRFKSSKDDITFILANDSVVNLKIETVSRNVSDITENFYDFKPKEKRIDPLNKISKGANISELELMKAMIRSDEIVGYKSRSLIRTINTGEKNISAKLVKVYTGPKFNGYIFKLVNNSKDESYAIDLKSLTFGRPNVALLSQSDLKILSAKGLDDSNSNMTFLRIVTRPTSVYYSVTLPIAPIKKQ